MIRGAQAAQQGASTRLKCPTSADRTSLGAELRRTPFTSRAASAGSTFGHAVIAAIGEHFPPREQVKASMRNTLFGSSAHFILGSIRDDVLVAARISKTLLDDYGLLMEGSPSRVSPGSGVGSP